jgi:hypothetical protein
MGVCHRLQRAFSQRAIDSASVRVGELRLNTAGGLHLCPADKTASWASLILAKASSAVAAIAIRTRARPPTLRPLHRASLPREHLERFVVGRGPPAPWSGDRERAGSDPRRSRTLHKMIAAAVKAVSTACFRVSKSAPKSKLTWACHAHL